MRTLGRALIGAISGLIIVSLALFIATDYFHLHLFENSAIGDRSFRTAIGLGALAFALLAVISGTAKIRGKTAATIKGVLIGIAAGVVFGSALGSMAAEVRLPSKAGITSKSGITLGIFVGGPLGAIVGGVLGFSAGKRPEQKTAPTREAENPEGLQ